MSIGLQVVIKGTEAARAHLARASAETKTAIEKTMWKAVYQVQRDAKRNLTGGHPLFVRTGRLRTSVTAAVMKKADYAVEGVVGSDVKYGPVHEFGAKITAHGPAMTFFYFERGISSKPTAWIQVKSVTIPRRPWLAPAFEKNAKKINEMFTASMEGVVRRANE